MDATATPRAAANALVALAVGVPVTILIPFIGWLYGWQGALAVVVLGIVPAYLFGSWIARRGSSTRSLWCLLCSTLPLTLAAWGISTHAGEPAGWFWLAAAVLTFAATLAGSRTPRGSSAT